MTRKSKGGKSKELRNSKQGLDGVDNSKQQLQVPEVSMSEPNVDSNRTKSDDDKSVNNSVRRSSSVDRRKTELKDWLTAENTAASKPLAGGKTIDLAAEDQVTAGGTTGRDDRHRDGVRKRSKKRSRSRNQSSKRNKYSKKPMKAKLKSKHKDKG